MNNCLKNLRFVGALSIHTAGVIARELFIPMKKRHTHYFNEGNAHTIIAMKERNTHTLSQ